MQIKSIFGVVILCAFVYSSPVPEDQQPPQPTPSDIPSGVSGQPLNQVGNNKPNESKEETTLPPTRKPEISSSPLPPLEHSTIKENVEGAHKTPEKAESHQNATPTKPNSANNKEVFSLALFLIGYLFISAI